MNTKNLLFQTGVVKSIWVSFVLMGFGSWVDAKEVKVTLVSSDTRPLNVVQSKPLVGGVLTIEANGQQKRATYLLTGEIKDKEIIFTIPDEAFEGGGPGQIKAAVSAKSGFEWFGKLDREVDLDWWSSDESELRIPVRRFVERDVRFKLLPSTGGRSVAHRSISLWWQEGESSDEAAHDTTDNEGMVKFMLRSDRNYRITLSPGGADDELRGVERKIAGEEVEGIAEPVLLTPLKPVLVVTVTLPDDELSPEKKSKLLESVTIMGNTEGWIDQGSTAVVGERIWVYGPETEDYSVQLDSGSELLKNFQLARVPVVVAAVEEGEPATMKLDLATRSVVDQQVQVVEAGSGKAIVGRIRLLSDSSPTKAVEAVADREGKAVFSDVPVGPAWLTHTVEGRMKIEKRINVDGESLLRVELQREAKRQREQPPQAE